MNRRSLLRGAIPATVGLLAGCTGGGSVPDSPTDSTDTSPPSTAGNSPTPSETDSPNSTDSPVVGESELVDRSFIIENNECGSPGNSASATIDGDTIIVTGTIDGSDTCHTARLGRASISDDGETLTVGVEAYVPESTATKACGQCIVEIDYRSTFAFEGGRPGRVVVAHDGAQVAKITLPE